MKNSQLQKHKKALRQIENFMSQLPEVFLRESATTHALFTEWLRQRGYAINLGKLLGARFGLGGGNPALEGWRSGRIDEFEYQLITAIVDFYDMLFTVIQTGWPYIKEDLQKITQNCPRSEIEYFKELLREQANNNFTECVKGWKVTVCQLENLAKSLRDAIRQEINPKNRGIPLLDPQNKKNKSEFYLPFAIFTAEKYSKMDAVMLDKLNNFKLAVAKLADFVVIGTRAERSSNPPGRFKSCKFENGLRYRGVRGGWKLVS